MAIETRNYSFGGTEKVDFIIKKESKYIFIENPVQANFTIEGFDKVRSDVISALEDDLEKYKDLWKKLSDI